MNILTRLALFIVGPDEAQRYIAAPVPAPAAPARPPVQPRRPVLLDPIPAGRPDPVGALIARHRQAAAGGWSAAASLPGAPGVRDIVIKRAGSIWRGV
jgi:hypothetical protein